MPWRVEIQVCKPCTIINFHALSMENKITPLSIFMWNGIYIFDHALDGGIDCLKIQFTSLPKPICVYKRMFVNKPKLVLHIVREIELL